MPRKLSWLARIQFFGTNAATLHSPPTNCSHGWRGITTGRDLIGKHTGWAIGNGESMGTRQDPTRNANGTCNKTLCKFHSFWPISSQFKRKTHVKTTILSINPSSVGLRVYGHSKLLPKYIWKSRPWILSGRGKAGIHTDPSQSKLCSMWITRNHLTPSLPLQFWKLSPFGTPFKPSNYSVSFWGRMEKTQRFNMFSANR